MCKNSLDLRNRKPDTITHCAPIPARLFASTLHDSFALNAHDPRSVALIAIVFGLRPQISWRPHQGFFPVGVQGPISKWEREIATANSPSDIVVRTASWVGYESKVTGALAIAHDIGDQFDLSGGVAMRSGNIWQASARRRKSERGQKTLPTRQPNRS
jgi:hypothetical protein